MSRLAPADTLPPTARAIAPSISLNAYSPGRATGRPSTSSLSSRTDILPVFSQTR